MPAALKNSKPAPVHESLLFTLDAPDMKVFNAFHEKLQDAIKKSPEWAQYARANSGAPSDAGGSGFDDMPDDIPFVTASMHYDMTTSKARKMAKYEY